MDNELEIVANEGLKEIAEASTSPAQKYGTIAGASLAAFIAGILVDRFVIKPIVAKIEDARAAKKAKVVEKTEDSKPDVES